MLLVGLQLVGEKFGHNKYPNGREEEQELFYNNVRAWKLCTKERMKKMK